MVFVASDIEGHMARMQAIAKFDAPETDARKNG